MEGAPQIDSSSQLSAAQLGLAAIAKGDFDLARQYLQRRARLPANGEGPGQSAREASASPRARVIPEAPSDGDNESTLMYLLARMNFLEVQNRQILDSIRSYEPSTLRSEIRQDVAEIVESQAQHFQQIVDNCIGNAAEAALVNERSTGRVAIQAAPVSLANPHVPKSASACGDTRGNKRTSSEPVHESNIAVAIEPCQLPLHLVSEGTSDEQSPAANVEQANKKTNLQRQCVTFHADADSVKALAASAGWLKGVHCKHVTQPGAMAEKMLRAPSEIQQHEHMLETQEKTIKSKLQQIISSQAFETASGMLIFLSACFAGVVAHVSIGKAVNGEADSLPLIFDIMQLVLTCAFQIEWAFRLAAYGCNFFTCRDKGWHMFDTIIVAFSMADIIIGLIVRGRGGKSASVSNLLRILRFFRLVRAIRMIRVLRVFQELRYIMQSLRRSAILLVWPLVFLLMLVYMCTIVISAGLPEEILEATAGRRNLLIDKFGSFHVIMNTLFMSASGGMDWSVPGELLSSGEATSYVAFVVFIILSKFLLFNLLSGIFVLSVFENCKADDQRMLQEQLLTHNSSGARLRAILEELDVTGIGAISGNSLENLLDDPLVADILDDLDLEPSEVAGIFKLLDVDGGGYVNIDEFIITMFRLRSHSQAVDLPSLLHESRKIGCHLMKAMEENENRVTEVKETLKRMQYLSDQSFAAILGSRKSQKLES